MTSKADKHGNPGLAALSEEVARLAGAAFPATVAVHAGHAGLSGFVWQKGLIVTAEEPLPEVQTAEVRFHDGTSAAAKVLGRDASTDVVLLAVESDAAPAAFSDAPPRAGSLTVAAGSGGVAGLGLVARVAGPWRSMRGGEIDARIELDLRMKPDLEGSLALAPDGSGAWGMIVSGPRRSALVIPHATVARVAGVLRAHGRVARGYLGLGLQPVEVQGEDRRGAIVVSVDTDGPAAKAGLRQGDVVVALGDTPVTSTRQLLRALGPGSVGQRLEMDIRRAGQVHRLEVTIAERPE